MVRDVTLFYSIPDPVPGFPLARKYREQCVTGRVSGTSGMEFQTAGAVGIKPEMRVKVFTGGWSRAEFARIGDSIYKIYRQYPAGPRYSELYLSAWIEPAELYTIELLSVPMGTGVFDPVEPERRPVQAAVRRQELSENFAGDSHDPMELLVFWMPDAREYHGEHRIEFGGLIYELTAAAMIGAAMQLTGRRKV